MQKLILLVLLVTYISANTPKYVIECKEPYQEYQYYSKISKETKNSDTKTRFADIAKEFLNHYKMCKKSIKNPKLKHYKMFKEIEDD